MENINPNVPKVKFITMYNNCFIRDILFNLSLDIYRYRINQS